MPPVVLSAELDAGTTADVRALLDAAFEGSFTDVDWRHALGGVHALVHAGGRLVAHGAVVPRRLEHGGRLLRAGYVEAVAVDAAHRRGGTGSAVMAALESVVRRTADLGALSATDAGAALYAARGWVRWRGPTSVRTPDGAVVATPDDDGSVFVLPGAVPLDPAGGLTCDWRDGDLW